MQFSVIPAKAGIQFFQILMNSLDSGFHRSDDFLQDHQSSIYKNWNLSRKAVQNRSPRQEMEPSGYKGKVHPGTKLEFKTGGELPT
jgi:hypothetical protein